MDLIYRFDPFQPLTKNRIVDGNAARSALCEGNDRFVRIVQRMQERSMGAGEGEPLVISVNPVSLGLPLYTGGAAAQIPFALVLGCSDARAPVEAVFDQAFNDIFVVRIAGNVLGTECLGSVDYAVRNLRESLKLVVVLGHSGCGAVTAAVDGYLAPQAFSDIAFSHALRSLVDRIQIAVRGAAKAIRQVGGPAIEQCPGYREALLEAAVYFNAALTAFDLQREIRSLGEKELPIVYGVYDLAGLRVKDLPDDRRKPPRAASALGTAPQSVEDFTALGTELATRLLGTGDVGVSGEW
jgi:carbonic anhydrase